MKPGGRQVITDLDRREHEFPRTEHHDRWMEFARDADLVNVRELGCSRRGLHGVPDHRGPAAANGTTYTARRMRWYLRSKIHQAVVTEADVDYVGSITIDRALMERVGIDPGERVLVTSLTSGARLETYVIPGEPGSGRIGMNGAAAHLVRQGERIIIMGFELSERPVTPTVILVDAANRYVRDLSESGDPVAV